MALKFLDESGSGSVSDAITCIEYATANGADIMNNSWGGGGFSQALRDAIQAANDEGILFVAAAGNSSSDNDVTPSYPSNYEVPNVIAVAAIDRNGALANFSSFGAGTVDLGAPGVDILSSTATSDSSYEAFNGTSMAAPHVAGVAALLASEHTGIGLIEMKNRLLNTTVPLESLAGRTVSGGMVDAHAALTVTADGVLELRATSGGLVEAGNAADFFIGVSDLNPVTAATVSANLDGASPTAFLDDGLGSDKVANDGVYSANLAVPEGVSTVNLNVTASAADKTPASEVFSFAVLSRPENDDFADRIVPVDDATVSTGTNIFSTSEAGEPINPSVAGGGTVWWSWVSPVDGDITITTIGSDFDTTLAVYQGETLGGLSLLGSNDDASGLQSAVTFAAVAGVAYQIQVDGFSGAKGDIRLNHPPQAGGGEGSPVIITQPSDRAVIIGDPFSLVASAISDTPVEYQWSLDGTPIPEATEDTYAVEAAAEADEGNYTVTVSNEFGSSTSNPAFVAVEQVGVLPGNDDFANATILVDGSGRVSGSNVRASGEPSEPEHADVSSPLASVWYRWTAPEDGSATFDTLGSDFDTTIAVYTGGSVADLTLVAENDDASGLQSEVAFPVSAGTTYRMAVDGFSSSQGTISLNYVLSDEELLAPNDMFADRITLVGSATVTGSNRFATGEPSEPDHANSSGTTASVWWSWTAPASGEVVIDTFGSDFDTKLAVYTGESVDALTPVASNDDSGGGFQSQVSFDVPAGIRYAIAVDGFGAGTGDIQLTVDFTSDAPPSGRTALYFYDDRAAPHAGLSALHRLGHVVTVVKREMDDLPADLTSRDLMVIEIHDGEIAPTDEALIAEFVDVGGPAIISYGLIRDSPLLRDAFGVSMGQSLPAPQDLQFWEPADPVFAGLSGPLVPLTETPPGDDFGDKLVAAVGATALGGYLADPGTGEAAIVRGNGGRTIMNGFRTIDFDRLEMVKLLENEVSQVMENGDRDFYAEWTDSFPGFTDLDPALDADGGRLPNAVEWALGGDPTDPSDDRMIMPTLESTPDTDGKLRFVFRRNTQAGGDAATAIRVEYGSDLSDWTAATHQGTGNDQITITEVADGFGPGLDSVTVALPTSLVADDRLFARLAVSVAQP